MVVLRPKAYFGDRFEAGRWFGRFGSESAPSSGSNARFSGFQAAAYVNPPFLSSINYDHLMQLTQLSLRDLFMQSFFFVYAVYAVSRWQVGTNWRFSGLCAAKTFFSAGSRDCGLLHQLDVFRTLAWTSLGRPVDAAGAEWTPKAVRVRV